MKRNVLAGIGILSVIVAGIGTYEAYRGETPLAVDQVDMLDAAHLVQQAAPQALLSDTERDALIYMREEEKLAHDVYTTLGTVWGTRIFSNIAASEATHTEAVRTLLARYNVADPVVSDSVGVFSNPTFTDLYTKLVAQGSASLPAALGVGATIEDLDLADLAERLGQTDNADIITVFQNLARGSRNHLRSFVGQLESRGGSYTAQYIQPTELASIIGSPRETGATR